MDVCSHLKMTKDPTLEVLMFAKVLSEETGREQDIEFKRNDYFGRAKEIERTESKNNLRNLCALASWREAVFGGNKCALIWIV